MRPVAAWNAWNGRCIACKVQLLNLFDRDLLQVHDKVHAVPPLIEAAQAFDVRLSWTPIAARDPCAYSSKPDRCKVQPLTHMIMAHAEIEGVAIVS